MSPLAAETGEAGAHGVGGGGQQGGDLPVGDGRGPSSRCGAGPGAPGSVRRGRCRSWPRAGRRPRAGALPAAAQALIGSGSPRRRRGGAREADDPWGRRAGGPPERGPGPPPRSRCPRCRSSGCARGSGRSRGAGRGPPGSRGPAYRPALRRSPRCRPRRGGCPCGCRPPRRPPARRPGRSRVRVPAVSVIMMMRLPRGGRAGRGPADQDVDGAHPSSYQVTWGLDRRRCVAGRPGRGQDRDQGRPPGPPVKFRVTRPRRTGTYILHVQICRKGPDRAGAPEEDR